MKYKIVSVSLDEDEKQAIKKLANVKCDNLSCDICPFCVHNLKNNTTNCIVRLAAILHAEVLSHV